MSDPELRVGMAWQDITPPYGVELSGYGFYRNRKARTGWNTLEASALVLEQNDVRVAILSLDLLAISAETARETRALIERVCDIPAANVLFACSHTHSGPATIFLRGCGEVDPGYVALLPRYLVGTVQRAMEKREPMQLWAGQTTLEGLAKNRVDANGAVDTAVQVLDFIGAPDSARYAVFTCSCHPVTTTADDAGLGPDFPGHARTILEQGWFYRKAMFLQGSCGDVNPVLAHTQPYNAYREGQMLAGAAFIALGQAEKETEGRSLRCLTRTVELPLQPPTREELERRRDDYRALMAERDPDSQEGRTAQFWAEAAESLLMQRTGESDPWLEMLRDAQGRIQAATGREPRLNEVAQAMDLPPDSVAGLLRLQQEQAAAENAVPKTLSCELQAIRIGEVAILAHPTELFAEFGLEIKRRSPFAHTFVVGYANGFLGYIPNEAEFARKGYAADTVPYMLDLFPYAPQVGRVFTEACLQLLEDLSREP